MLSGSISLLLVADFFIRLDVASTMIQSGRYKRVIVIAADKMSSIVDYTDRQTCVLFGDGAAAVLVEVQPKRMLVYKIHSYAPMEKDYLFYT